MNNKPIADWTDHDFRMHIANIMKLEVMLVYVGRLGRQATGDGAIDVHAEYAQAKALTYQYLEHHGFCLNVSIHESNG